MHPVFNLHWFILSALGISKPWNSFPPRHYCKGVCLWQYDTGDIHRALVFSSTGLPRGWRRPTYEVLAALTCYYQNLSPSTVSTLHLRAVLDHIQNQSPWWRRHFEVTKWGLLIPTARSLLCLIQTMMCLLERLRFLVQVKGCTHILLWWKCGIAFTCPCGAVWLYLHSANTKAPRQHSPQLWDPFQAEFGSNFLNMVPL